MDATLRVNCVSYELLENNETVYYLNGDYNLQLKVGYYYQILFTSCNQLDGLSNTLLTPGYILECREMW
jgi:hypothetical protein